MNDIDLLFSRIEEINHKLADEITADDIDTLIAYHRHNRTRLAAGEKPTKPKQSIDLSAIMTKAKTTAAADAPKPEIRYTKNGIRLV